MINQEQFLSLIRTLLQIGSAYAIGRGWVDPTVAGEIVAAAVMAATVGWSMWAHRKKSLIAATAKFPEVSEIMTNTNIARSIPNDKVKAVRQ